MVDKLEGKLEPLTVDHSANKRENDLEPRMELMMVEKLEQQSGNQMERTLAKHWAEMKGDLLD